MQNKDIDITFYYISIAELRERLDEAEKQGANGVKINVDAYGGCEVTAFYEDEEYYHTKRAETTNSIEQYNLLIENKKLELIIAMKMNEENGEYCLKLAKTLEHLETLKK